jgi:hypothetical protein
MKKTSSVLTNFSISSLRLVFILLILEGGIRLSGYHGMNINFQPVEYSNEYGWQLKPSYSGI